MIGQMNKCPICGSESKLIHKGTRDNLNVDVYQCTGCQTKYLSSLVAGDYKNGFMHGSKSMDKEEILAQVESTRVDDKRRANALKNRCFDKSVLDFGCGFGGFLKYISEDARVCMGVELGETERVYMHENDISCVETIEELKEPYDVITMFHVLEHLENPVEWLKKIRNYINEDGRLYVEVPNANDILLSLYNSSEFADFTYWSAHLYLYTKESLSMIIEKSGCWEIVNKGQIQRYPISNHLMWLSKGKPGGHMVWDFLDSRELNHAYEKMLEQNDMCDTLFFELEPK